MVTKSKVSAVGTVETDYDFKRDFELKDYENWLRGIVHSVIKRFSRNTRWDFDELMGEAYLALCEKAESFNPDYSNSLLGYAKQYIHQRLYEFISVNMYTFKVRYYNIRHDEEKLETVNRMESTLWSDHKSSPNRGLDSESELSSTPLQMHASGHMTPDNELALIEECEILRGIVNNDLKKRERRTIVRRHRDGESFQQIADKLGISKESARRVYHQGMEKLKVKAAQAGIKVDND